MMYFFSLVIASIITLVMLAPFGVLVMYAVVALRQIAIGNKESNAFKKRGAQKALALSISGLLLLFFVWLYIMSKI